MKRTGGMRLGTRLFLLVLIPTLGMLWFSVLDSWQHAAQVRETEQQRALLAATQNFDALARELAAERGLYFAFSGTSFTRRRILLERQFRATDIAVRRMQTFMDGAGWIERQLPAIWQEYARLQTRVAELLAGRGARENRRLESLAAVAGYTETISFIHDIIELLQSLSTDSRQAELERQYNELQAIILATGVQRAIGAWILAHDELPFALGNQLLHTRSQIALSERRLAAMPGADRYLQAFSIEAELINASLVDRFLEDVSAYFQRLHQFRHLQSSIGYGGLIHQFKNYLLRGEEQYRIGFEEQWAAVQDELDRAVDSGTLSQENVAAIRQVQVTFEEYAQRMAEVEDGLERGEDIRAIDRSVRLNDLPALEAIRALFRFSGTISGEEWFRIQSQRIALQTQRGELIIGDMLLYKEAQHDAAQARLLRNTGFTLLLLLASLLTMRWIFRDILGSIRAVSGTLQEIAEDGRLPATPATERQDEIGDLHRALAALVNTSRSIVKSAGLIGQGNYSVNLKPRSNDDELVLALNTMVANLHLLSAEQAAENLLQGRLVEISSILRRENTPEAVAETVLRYVCAEVGVRTGVMYLLGEDGRYPPRQAIGIDPAGIKPVVPGAGLVGQAMEGRDITPVTGLPGDYLRLRSGVGDALPGTVYVVPLWERHNCVGAMELGSFGELSAGALQFLHRIQEPLAMGIQSLVQQQELEAYVGELSQRKQALEEREQELQSLNQTLQEQADSLASSEEELRMLNDTLSAKSASLQASRDQLEKQAQQLEQASRYKSEFLANMSHELRTPLNSILILSHVLAENPDGRLDEDEVRSAKTIENSGRSLLNLINDILDMSKVEAGKLEIVPEEVNLRLLLEDLRSLFDPLAAEKNVELRLSVDEAVPERWRTDGHRVTQVLRNFLSNAIKFTSAGHVELRTRIEPGHGDTGPLLRFDVEDTGIGIDPAQLERVFEEFQQEDGSTSRQYGGTGLGLAISRRLGALLGGRVTAASSKGLGSTFSLHIPQLEVAEADAGRTEEAANAASRTQEAARGTRKAPAGPPPDATIVKILQGRRVVVADDDTRTCFALSAALRPYGVEVVLARSGVQCLDKLANHPDTSLVIMDLIMPGMDGLDTIRRIRSDPRWRDLPILVLTAGDPDNHRAACMEVGANAFMNKPADGPQLAGELARLLGDS